jgi:histidinol-phosphate aminotransferase
MAAESSFEEAVMTERSISRRQFAQRLGTAAATALIAPEVARSLTWPVEPARDMSGAEILLDSNENPYGPSPKAREAMTRSQGVASRYPDALEDQMIDALARLHRVDREQIILGCGSGEILRMADMAFSAPGKNVVVAEPTFEAVLGYARATHAEPVKIPLTSDFRHDLPRMAAAINERTGLVYVCNPNNPTATIVTREELAAFLPKVPPTAVVLVDEAYFHFVEDPAYASAFEWFEKTPNLLIARTFSKIYGMAGMRLGYAVGSKENIRAMRMHKTHSNANAAVLEAGLVSLSDPAHVAEQRRLLNGSRKWLCKELDRDGRRYMPSHANFIMIDVKSDVRPVIQKFRERSVRVGRPFPPLNNWLRVSIGTQKEMESFLTALREVVPAAAAAAA